VARRTWRTVAQVPGFTRGIDFVGPLAFIGLSQVRESAVFSGIPLVERLSERTCGVWVVHIETGETVGFLRFDAGVQEIFAVQVLRNVRFPELMEWNDDRMAHSYVLPDDALADVAVPTEEELAKTPAYHFQRANRLYDQGKTEEAIAAYRRCLELEPTFPNARFNLGVALGDAGRFAEASACMEEVLRDQPDRVEAYNSLGYLASRQGEPNKAIAYWQRAIALRPSYAAAHLGLGLTLLQIGDYERGFAECEWRWRAGHSGGPPFAQPRWDGRSIPGRALLVVAERGTVDALQFARYLPLAAERCGELIVAGPADLLPLFAAVPGVAELREADKIGNLHFDYQVPLLSLPHVFRTRFGTVPATVPYIDAARLKAGSDRRLAAVTSTAPRVGLFWGSQTTGKPSDGTCPARAFLPLLRIPGIAFYALQPQDEHSDLTDLAAGPVVHQMPANASDMGGLAAIVDQLDLMIGVDGPVIHLAGAMGKPVWVLLTYVPEWRWPLTGKTTPWYPTVRLFRQTEPHEWSSVMEEAARALEGRDWTSPPIAL
jgi:hypothetical protein